ncbi:MAG: CNNM domain-containing protein [Gammaproteobacteria bacterium]|nr:CNNM domain-containing protein [Gammaproteobacteria bacterium]
MDDVSLVTLAILLVVLLILSAFFSASETAMMSLNRYRLNHLAEEGHRSARLAVSLLEHPDRLLGTILLGNNLVNNAAAAVATVIAIKVAGEAAIAFATGAITLIVLVFAEIPPKTVAALYSEQIAFRAVYPLAFLIKVTRPIVVGVNTVGSLLPRIFGISLKRRDDALSPEELRTIVKQSTQLIPRSHRGDAASHPRAGNDHRRRRHGPARQHRGHRPRGRLGRHRRPARHQPPHAAARVSRQPGQYRRRGAPAQRAAPVPRGRPDARPVPRGDSRTAVHS